MAKNSAFNVAPKKIGLQDDYKLETGREAHEAEDKPWQAAREVAAQVSDLTP